jgi:Pectate lyase superfamily protein
MSLQRSIFIAVALLTPAFAVAQSPAPCHGDGKTDVTSCITGFMSWAHRNGSTASLLLPGTYVVSQPIVIPDKMSLVGSGRGDPGYVGTVLQASASFPANQPLVVMGGSTGGPYFSVQVTNMTLDCHGRASHAIENTQAEEHSYGRQLLIEGCPDTGVLVQGSGAQNSGPFDDLEIYPGVAGTATTTCIKVSNAISFRGVSNLTCNAEHYQTQPRVAIQVDGGSSYTGIHVEHFATAVGAGSASNSADGMFIANAQFGPDVATGIAIANNSSNQNISLFGVRCFSCSQILTDSITGRTLSTTALGFYLLGDGGGPGNTLLTSASGLQAQVYAPVTQGATAIGPGNNQHWNSTLTVWDATSWGQTRTIEADAANQGDVNLHEYRDSAGRVMAAVKPDGTFEVPSVQYIPESNNLPCDIDHRGTSRLEPSSSGDHAKMCAMTAAGTMSWIQIF